MYTLFVPVVTCPDKSCARHSATSQGLAWCVCCCDLFGSVTKTTTPQMMCVDLIILNTIHILYQFCILLSSPYCLFLLFLVRSSCWLFLRFFRATFTWWVSSLVVAIKPVIRMLQLAGFVLGTEASTASCRTFTKFSFSSTGVPSVTPHYFVNVKFNLPLLCKFTCI